MRFLLDTSVLVGPEVPEADAAISVISLAELHSAVLRAASPEERARRLQRMATVEACFEPLPVDAAVARECGRLAALLGGRDVPDRELLVGATANVHGATVLTRDRNGYRLIADVVDVQLA